MKSWLSWHSDLHWGELIIYVYGSLVCLNVFEEFVYGFCVILCLSIFNLCFPPLKGQTIESLCLLLRF